jgi:hypothetical protein
VVRKIKSNEDDEDENVRELTIDEIIAFRKMKKDWESATIIYTAIYRLVIALGAVAAAIAAIKVTFGQYLSRMFAP